MIVRCDWAETSRNGPSLQILPPSASERPCVSPVPFAQTGADHVPSVLPLRCRGCSALLDSLLRSIKSTRGPPSSRLLASGRSPGSAAVSWRCLSFLSIMARQGSRRGRTRRPGTRGLGPSVGLQRQRVTGVVIQGSPIGRGAPPPFVARHRCSFPIRVDRRAACALGHAQLTAGRRDKCIHNHRRRPPQSFCGFFHTMDAMVAVSRRLSTRRSIVVRLCTIRRCRVYSASFLVF
ncbi:hypothetical protein C8Q79DRAFT_573874 [Trametes meyenii]|nr:hypothetical protein C8Q79DRAFT_573874 [Trametes meyenii]